MAARPLGTIRLVGTVYIHWENGAQTEVGTVSTFVEMSLDNDEPVTITARERD